MGKMIIKKDWQEFRQSGLLWAVNSFLHMFGWAISVNVDMETGKVLEAYPSRCHFRGFGEEQNTQGYTRIQENFMQEHIAPKEEGE